MQYAAALLSLGFAFTFSAFAQETPALPQEPKPPFPYTQEEVTYRNPQAPGIELAGTLTKPKQGRRFPAVLLIPGAGPEDRDETMAGHKPFGALADYLTRRGIAVLRSDRRGAGKSTGKFENATTADFASDGEAGVQFLLNRTDVDPKHVGLIGHGEGAIIASMIAVKMPQIAFLVLLAGTAIPGEDVLVEQTERAETAAHLPHEEIIADKKIGTLLYGLVREGKSEPELRQALYHLPRKYDPYTAKWQKQLRRLEAPWLRFFLSYDPATALEQVKCPILALQGEKDMQVPPEQNVSAMKAAFARAGNHDAEVDLLPGLNYMFQPAETGLSFEYARVQESISPDVLSKIGNWITKHCR